MIWERVFVVVVCGCCCFRGGVGGGCLFSGGGGDYYFVVYCQSGSTVIILCNKLVLIRLLWSVLVSEREIRETRDTLPVISCGAYWGHCRQLIISNCCEHPSPLLPLPPPLPQDI